VIAGMLAATCIAIFFVPVLFVLVERLARREARATTPPGAAAGPGGAPPGPGAGH
jgi:hypothetical protein